MSGAREFITESENGYICKVGDFQRIADCIRELVLDRKKLEKYGVKCHEIIQQKCNPDRYIEYCMEHLVG